MQQINDEGVKQEVCKIMKADLHFPDRAIEVSIEVNRGPGTQNVSISLSQDASDFWKKVKHLQIQFQIDNLRELEGKYCYALLSNEVNEVIIGFALLEVDKRYDESSYNQTILRPEKYEPKPKDYSYTIN